MTTALKFRRLAVLVVGLLVAVVAVVALRHDPAGAHGSTVSPASRYYSCRFTTPDNPMCRRVQQTSPQAVYDWNGVSHGDADGRHREKIPDGQLCSAGRTEFAAFDEPGDWPTTRVSPGPYEVVFQATAAHAAKYWQVYLSRSGFDPRRDRLRWSDLNKIYESGPVAGTAQPRFTVPLPRESGRHVLYLVWQRSTSTEAFYACSDVDFGGGGNSTSGENSLPAPDIIEKGPQPTGTGTATPPTASATGSASPTAGASSAPAAGTAAAEPSASPSASPPASGDAGMAEPGAPTSMVPGVEATTLSEQGWGTGVCRQYRVDNRTGAAVQWEVAVPLPFGTVTSSWDAILTPMGDHAMARGVGWNARLESGEATSFGICAAG